MINLFQVHLSEVNGPEPPDWALVVNDQTYKYIEDVSEDYKIEQRVRIGKGYTASLEKYSPSSALQFGNCEIISSTSIFSGVNSVYVSKRSMNPFLIDDGTERNTGLIIITMDSSIGYTTSKIGEYGEILCTFHNKGKTVIGCIVACDLEALASDNKYPETIVSMSVKYGSDFYKVNLVQNQDSMVTFVDKISSKVEKERLEKIGESTTPLSKTFIRNIQTCVAGAILYPINKDVSIDIPYSKYLWGIPDPVGLQVNDNGIIIDNQYNNTEINRLRELGIRSVLLYGIRDKHQILGQLRPLYVFKTVSTDNLKIKCIRTN